MLPTNPRNPSPLNDGINTDKSTVVTARTWLVALAGENLASHFRLPLFRNGYALLIGSATTSSLGFVFWVLAARFYSAETVGLDSAALSAMLLLSGISQLSLTSVLARYVPLAGGKTARLILYSYLVSVIVAAVTSTIFILGLNVWAPALIFISSDRNWQILFVLSTMLWCVFALQDSALTGLRQALWIPLENTIFAGVKIVLLIILAGSFPAVGILLSWNIPVLISLLPINLLIFRWLVPGHVRATSERVAPITPNLIAKFVGGNYLGSLFFLASTTLLPIMVTNLCGPSANAYFYPPWMIVTALQFVAVNLSTSLTVEAAFNMTKLSLYSKQVLLQTARLLTPLVVLVILGAPLVLRVFGSDYATEGSALLQLMALGTLPNIFVTLYVSLARVQNRTSSVMLVQGVLSLMILGLSYILLPILGIIGVGIAWLVSQTIVAVALYLTRLRPILQLASTQQDTSHRDGASNVNL